MVLQAIFTYAHTEDRVPDNPIRTCAPRSCALRWDDVVYGALRIRRKNVHGQLFPYIKTRQNRRVKLLAPLGADLAEWALASGRRTGLVIPRADGTPWTRWDWSN